MTLECYQPESYTELKKKDPQASNKSHTAEEWTWSSKKDLVYIAINKNLTIQRAPNCLHFSKVPKTKEM